MTHVKVRASPHSRYKLFSIPLWRPSTWFSHHTESDPPLFWFCLFFGVSPGTSSSNIFAPVHPPNLLMSQPSTQLLINIEVAPFHFRRVVARFINFFFTFFPFTLLLFTFAPVYCLPVILFVLLPWNLVRPHMRMCWWQILLGFFFHHPFVGASA